MNPNSSLAFGESAGNVCAMTSWRTSAEMRLRVVFNCLMTRAWKRGSFVSAVLSRSVSCCLRSALECERPGHYSADGEGRGPTHRHGGAREPPSPSPQGSEPSPPSWRPAPRPSSPRPSTWPARAPSLRAAQHCRVTRRHTLTVSARSHNRSPGRAPCVDQAPRRASAALRACISTP